MRAPRSRVTTALRGAVIAVGLIALAGCQADELGYGPKAERPLSHAIKAEMAAKKMKPSDPILVRLFKEESKLEVWKRTSTGRYALLQDYDICKWSGKLGPKKKEGDRQAPEGFYTIRPAQMNPNSSYHLSFNTGFPNAFDRAHGRTGSNLMVHGACSSRGCYAMTDEQIQEIYALAREAFKGGQRDFQFEAFPFRMTAENMARHADDENMPFWRMLKTGYDHFEVTHVPPKVDVCDKRYVFDAQPENANSPFIATAACPVYEVPEPLRLAVAAKEKADDEKTAMIVAKLEREREREKAWKNGDTAIAKLFGPGNEASETPRGASVPAGVANGGQASALAAYSTPGATPAPGAPVPPANPERDEVASTGSTKSGFFSSLFTGEERRPVSPVAPASERPANAPLPAQSATLPAAPATGQAAAAEATGPIPVPKETAAGEEKKEGTGSKVSKMVSRWFSFGKDGN
ncbi:murein L,D-transpeptidase family protein [Breoghania sp. JC706]|uniref:murein L,D-transpeptidase family protein n=1 Tax=Breoghania sp. JC706 TaxID=3117732 RepID=UPI00300957DF